MKKHEYYEILISRYKDKDLNAKEILEMERHLSACKSCRKFAKNIDSLSSFLLGKNTAHVNKRFTRYIVSIASIAAALLIFAGGFTALNNYFNDDGIERSMDSAIAVDIQNEEILEYNDYTPLSTYFGSFEDEENTNHEVVLSAYMYYVNAD